MSQNNKKAENPKRDIFQSRADKLSQIDALYREQIKKIYVESKNKLEHQDVEPKKNVVEEKKSIVFKKDQASSVKIPIKVQSPKSVSTSNVPESQSVSSKMLNSASQVEDKIRASMFLKGESTRTIEILRRENESKELKIRQLSHKCENLVQKLKKHLNQQQFQEEMETVRQFSDGKMQRLEHLFKIKQEEIFFKIKLQVIGLLQEFEVTKEELSEFNDISSESNLFSLMTRKLKTKLKLFRNREQENSFQLQKDKINTQKQIERIHFLTETNELLKLSESKLKAKIEDLKDQLNQYLERLKMREMENQSNENEMFRLKKQNQQINNVNQKLTQTNKNILNQKMEEKRLWEAKEKQMKILLNNYFVEKKKLETDLNQKEEEIQEIMIKIKFLQQENQRINRELVRWKERYEWSEKERNVQGKEFEEEKNAITMKFQEYKVNYNQSSLLTQRSQVEEALRKIEEYQRAYERIVLELDDERRLLQRSEEDSRERLEYEERQWLQRFKSLEKVKEEQLIEINQDCEARLSEMRNQYEKKEELLAEQMQARLRALLAQKDKRATEELIELQNENDELKREIGDLNRIIEVKESLINVINNKKI